ncbi:MAG: isoprenyl transferase [Syntrophomonadaceae bacterium]|jgi:undecaprenyl diphosphate synthase|nr:isoprenyl transferase [Syntrophomonadaceae bacterium]
MLRWLTAGISSPFKKNENALLKQLDLNRMPYHIAVIMDGNGRWAMKRNMSRDLGHRAGIKSLRSTVEACGELGIRILSIYAFSTENWKRPKEEVEMLMALLAEYIYKELPQLLSAGVKIVPIGRISELPIESQNALMEAVEKTKNNTKITINIALNYGGRAEIIDAVKKVAAKVQAKELEPKDITEDILASNLYTEGQPDPDLVIRPSGEQRISNFLIWQSAYAEFYTTNVLWPDFGKKHLLEAIIAYQKRDRRFGGLNSGVRQC